MKKLLSCASFLYGLKEFLKNQEPVEKLIKSDQSI